VQWWNSTTGAWFYKWVSDKADTYIILSVLIIWDGTFVGQRGRLKCRGNSVFVPTRYLDSVVGRTLPMAIEATASSWSRVITRRPVRGGTANRHPLWKDIKSILFVLMSKQ